MPISSKRWTKESKWPEINGSFTFANFLNALSFAKKQICGLTLYEPILAQVTRIQIWLTIFRHYACLHASVMSRCCSHCVTLISSKNGVCDIPKNDVWLHNNWKCTYYSIYWFLCQKVDKNLWNRLSKGQPRKGWKLTWRKLLVFQTYSFKGANI